MQYFPMQHFWPFWHLIINYWFCLQEKFQKTEPSLLLGSSLDLCWEGKLSNFWLNINISIIWGARSFNQPLQEGRSISNIFRMPKRSSMHRWLQHYENIADHPGLVNVHFSITSLFLRVAEWGEGAGRPLWLGRQGGRGGEEGEGVQQGGRRQGAGVRQRRKRSRGKWLCSRDFCWRWYWEAACVDLCLGNNHVYQRNSLPAAN